MLFDPVGERRPGMADGSRGDPQAVDVPRVGLDLLEAQPRVDPLERHREVGRREIRGDLLLERAVRRAGPVDLDRRFRIEEEREEAEPLDVVEMEMREQQVEVVERLVGQRAAEIPDARACVDDDDGAARRSAARGTSCCRRSARSPLPAWRASPGIPRSAPSRGRTVDDAPGACVVGARDRLRSRDGAAPKREGGVAENGAALRALLEERAGSDRGRGRRARRLRRARRSPSRARAAASSWCSSAADAEVRRKGRRINTLDGGDFLGEIALLTGGAADGHRHVDLAVPSAHPHRPRLPAGHRRRCRP